MGNRSRSSYRWRASALTPAAAGQLCSAYEWSGLIDESLEFGKAETRPKDICRAFARTRYWATYNWLVGAVIALRLSFYDYGFRLVGESKAETAKIKEWLEEEDNGTTQPSRAQQVYAYVQDVWNEWLLNDNVISFWRDGTRMKPRPIVLPPEDHKYSDEFGEEILHLKHGLPPSRIDMMKSLTARQKQELKSSSVIKLTKEGALLSGGEVVDIGFHFEVLKRARIGVGLGWPRMCPVFKACAQAESLEASDELRAYASRKLYEKHTMGHEIRNGTHAGLKTHFLTDARSKAVEQKVKDKKGLVHLMTNFDHAVDWLQPDPKFFEGKKYASSIERLLLWSMPLGQMIFAKGVAPFLFEILKVQALKERELVGRHLERTIAEAFEPPAPVKVQWSVRCFKDMRTATDLIKQGLASGPVSQEAFLEEAGLDVETERERKAKEAELPDDVTLPKFDKDHGQQPAKPPGRKRGSPDTT
jgi:hypothetical protein